MHAIGHAAATRWLDMLRRYAQPKQHMKFPQWLPDQAKTRSSIDMMTMQHIKRATNLSWNSEEQEMNRRLKWLRTCRGSKNSSGQLAEMNSRNDKEAAVGTHNSPVILQLRQHACRAPTPAAALAAPVTDLTHATAESTLIPEPQGLTRLSALPSPSQQRDFARLMMMPNCSLWYQEVLLA